MKTYKQFNESLRDQMKGKSDENILKSLDKLNDSDKIKKIFKYKLSYDLLPDNLTVEGNLNCSNNQLTSLPDNLIVCGDLYCNNNQLTELPDNLNVKGSLYCINNQLPKDTQKPKEVKGEMYI